MVAGRRCQGVARQKSDGTRIWKAVKSRWQISFFGKCREGNGNQHGRNQAGNDAGA